MHQTTCQKRSSRFAVIVLIFELIVYTILAVCGLVAVVGLSPAQQSGVLTVNSVTVY